MNKIFKICYSIDRLQSRLDIEKDMADSLRHTLKKRMMKKRARIRGMVDEIHQKVAKFLCENYK